MDLFDIAKEKTVAEKLVELLREQELKIGTAESCTGGLLASAIVDVDGASKVFFEGIVSYSNKAKTARLGVSEIALREHGAVSEEVAMAMAEGLLSDNVDIAVSTTGIAGPGGGTATKQVGLVYIAVASVAGTEVKCYQFDGDRESVRLQAKNSALSQVLAYLQNLQ